MSQFKLPPNHFDTLKQSSPSHAGPAALPGASPVGIPGTPTVREGGLNRGGFAGGSIVLGTPSRGTTSASLRNAELIDEIDFDPSEERPRRKRKRVDDEDERAAVFGLLSTRELEIRVLLILICIAVVIVGLCNYAYHVRLDQERQNKKFAPPSNITHRELF